MTRQQSVWFSALFLITSVTALSLPFAGSAYAHEREINATYQVSEATELKLEFGVGTLKFERSTGAELEVELIAESGDSTLFNDGYVDAVELVAEQDGDRLRLYVPEQDDVELNWVVRTPKLAEIDVDLGVGEISGEVDATDMSIDLGVGEVDLEVFGAIDDVKTDVGIGEATISGGDSSSNERNFISASGRASGNGDARINVDAGIGEITIKIKN
ncbi:hypothetical protein [Pseudidiomarina insulisalsae]|uniref:Adhesin domain-containing protein n=1 Tax=Pseudidiomarina insulisalsae TaxID=575789 RepID=A0A432YCC4_9GAMM|nr:hypothetical protein [Pseudidiomarina insulisalsae]RUO58577.1 hypothetical protein CWI71_10530 [Pseudidiomarina insulisalsae]